MNKLEIKNLFAGYENKNVLFDISFSLNNGEILAVIGQNGSGKSTLLKAIACIIPYSKGSIYFENKNISNLKTWNLIKYGISLFTQNGLIFNSLKVCDHFDLTLMLKKSNERKRILEYCFNLFPLLKEIWNERGGNLSGGQRQILSFAILVAQETRCWLLDEPTAGLSQEAIKESLNILLKIKNDRKISIILVEHNYSVAFELADHLAVIKEGKWINSFKRDEFTKKEFLTKYLLN